MQPASSQALLGYQQVVPYLVDLLQDDCVAVRRVAGRCLDVIAEVDEGTAGTQGFSLFNLSFNLRYSELLVPGNTRLIEAGR